jgi:acetoacetate decarboxylase
MLGMVRGGLGAYIHRLPVDGEFTCEAGQTVWGFPKFMSEISITRNTGWETATLHVDGQHVLTQRIQTDGERAMPHRQQVSYAHRNGVTYRTPSVMGGERLATNFRGPAIELGDHSLADELRTLGLPKQPVFSTYIGRMRGIFYAAEPLAG